MLPARLTGGLLVHGMQGTETRHRIADTGREGNEGQERGKRRVGNKKDKSPSRNVNTGGGWQLRIDQGRPSSQQQQGRAGQQG